MKKKAKRNINKENIEILKSQGLGISRSVIQEQDRIFYKENESAITEGAREMKVLNMKKFFVRKGWTWPPRKHKEVTICHMINTYYGKDIVKHTPEDNLEKILKVYKKI